MESGFVEVRGVRLHYLRWGAGGRPLVLMHGNSHCAGVWAPIASGLAEAGFQVTAVDVRGHGQSDKPPDGYDWASLRDDLTGLLAQLDLRDVLLVAHSRGGGVSLLAAVAARERVTGALVYEPTLPVPSGAIAGGSTRLVERALNRRSEFPSREAAVAHYRRRDAFRLWDDAVLRAYVEQGTEEQPDGTVALRCPRHVEAALYHAMFEAGPWAGLRCPDLSVLAIFGGHSGRAREGQDPAARLRPYFPRVESHVLPGATHFGPMEQPAAFQALIVDFAGTLPGSTGDSGRAG
jgi:pimeloyl-ACP methyl ester carboxylesterase